MSVRLLLGAAAPLWLAGAPHQRPATACDTAAVRTSPAPVRAGTLFRVAMRWREATDAPPATVSGEPLHWRRSGDSVVAFAAAPVDSGVGVTLTLSCAGGADRSVRLATTAGAYRLEALRVAPRFAAPPDSALAARLEREAAEAAVVARLAHETPRLWTAPFVAPRASRITSPFGGGRTFNGTVTSRHMGTDYAGAVGAQVRAVNRGVVRLVGSFYLGGNVVYVDHGEGLVTAYLHLSRQRVAVGDTVERGQRIGDVGATGRVTGPHLHLIARYGTVTVDVASLIGATATSAAKSPSAAVAKAAAKAVQRSRRSTGGAGRR